MTETKLSFQSYFQTGAGDTIRMAPDTYRHLSKNQHIIDLVDSGITFIKTKIDWGRSGAFITRTVGFPTTIGVDHCLETLPISIDDQALFTSIPGRQGHVRTVMDGKTWPTHLLTIRLKFALRDIFIVDCWIGQDPKRSPDHPRYRSPQADPSEAIDFWTTHAILYQDHLPYPFPSTWRKLMDGAGTRR